MKPSSTLISTGYTRRIAADDSLILARAGARTAGSHATTRRGRTERPASTPPAGDSETADGVAERSVEASCCDPRPLGSAKASHR